MGWALCAAAALCVAGWWTARYGTRLLPFMRRQGLNLEARRGVPSVWLIAHIDSKSQPLSLLARAGAATCLASGWILASVAWGLSRVLGVPSVFEVVPLGIASISAVPLLFSFVGTSGTGALDNASGVVAILGAVRQLDLAIPVGVVVTSAEELGLAGARAWVEGRPASVVINCDGVDDTGIVTITTAGYDRSLWKTLSAGDMLGAPVRIRRTLPGVLMDSRAFADQGWAACTISQGTLRSLGRIHTRADNLSALSAQGIEKVQGVIASLTCSLIVRSSDSGNQMGGPCS